MNKIELEGCSPSPIVMNLKALGVFRTVSKKYDVLANWERDSFVLHSTMRKDELVDFFLDDYAPTPIVSPWNKGSGFYDKPGDIIDKILEAKSEKASEYKKICEAAKKIIAECIPQYPEFLNSGRKASGKEFTRNKSLLGIMKKKNLLLRQCRNKFPDRMLPWIDATYVLSSDDPSFGPILGVGAVDGNFDISVNFMELALNYVFVVDEKQRRESKEMLKDSLFGGNKMIESSVAYFYPGGYIGPNGTSNGYKEHSFINPWDYILAVEGTMFFAGSISRRSFSKKAAFPFTVNSSTAGYGTSTDEKNRGEVWIPFWDRPTTHDEIRYVFNEGRAHIGVRNASTGVDFARSLTSLGTEYGISGFERFGMFERKGQAYFATSIGRINTDGNTQVNLFTETDRWLDIIRRTKNLPQHVVSLLRKTDDAIIKFCMRKKVTDLQKVIINIGKIEQAVSSSTSLRDEIRPLQDLSSDWIDAAYDDTPEFRLATSLAAISNSSEYPIRCNLERVIKEQYEVRWKPDSPYMVSKGNSLIRSMVAVLDRRCLDSQIQGRCMQLDSRIPSPIKDVLLFLEGRLDVGKILDLLLPLSIISYKDYLPSWNSEQDVWKIPQFLPESYIAIKANFPPFTPNTNDGSNVFETSIINLLKSDNLSMAEKIMQRRLHINKINMATYENTNHRIMQEIQGDFTRRLAASFLFPLRKFDMEKILHSVIRKETV